MKSYDEAIDAVILWVDGADPALAAKRRQYAGRGDVKHDDVAGATRFADCGEIRWCVRSIERFAPWIRRIFIVTDGQDPHVETERIPVEIVDHQVIFRGFEEYLPTFNSLAIETMFWRIPGLSERFVYFNDDVSLIAPTQPEDFFTPDGRPIIYGSERGMMRGLASLTLDRIKHPTRHLRVKYRYMMLNAARMLGRGRYFLLQHTPHNIVRSAMKDYYVSHPEAILRNIRHRFRDIHQYSPIELQYLLADAELRDSTKALVYAEPRHQELVPAETAKFLCINSIDQFDEGSRDKAVEFIESRLR